MQQSKQIGPAILSPLSVLCGRLFPACMFPRHSLYEGMPLIYVYLVLLYLCCYVVCSGREETSHVRMLFHLLSKCAVYRQKHASSNSKSSAHHYNPGDNTMTVQVQRNETYSDNILPPNHAESRESSSPIPQVPSASASGLTVPSVGLPHLLGT